MNPVYITSVGSFLPNAPVDNAHIEQALGQVRGAPSRLRERVLAQNGIRSRHHDPRRRVAAGILIHGPRPA